MLATLSRLLALSSLPYSLAWTYTIKNEIKGSDFMGWNWETLDDPTHGRTNYVDLDTAVQKNLTSVNNEGQFRMAADSSNLVPPAARGRDSIRISSYESSGDLIILDLAHMPEGCATWPAFWTLSIAGPWPNGGEIDIIEGVNNSTYNLASLHTTPDCTMCDPRDQTGTTVSTNCDANVNFNQGCGTRSNDPRSFGPGFNNAGGGFYASSKDCTGIKIWFWSRNDPSVPPEVTEFCPENPLVSTDNWGTPLAYFPTTSCDYGSHFNDHKIVFDLTFCGDWAGSTWATSECDTSVTCEQYVNDNPSAFLEAYWLVNSLRTYSLMSPLPLCLLPQVI